jgi:hypothetical protein
MSMPAERGESSIRLLSRQGLLCTALLGICLLLIWPVVEVGINDDWVYTITTLDLARTGHLMFHGWASPMLGWQALWGALFAKLFRPSFTAVRLSVAPVALAVALLFQAVLRRFGLNSAHATFGTLVLVLSPIFLPLSATFMTDVPCLFAILICLYLCQRALDAPEDRTVLLWLTAAALSNIVLGSVRQVAWLGVLIIVPSCAWLLRRRRNVIPLTCILWLLAVACIWLMSSWFAHQPFTAPERLIPEPIHRHIIHYGFVQILRSIATALLLLLPVLAIGLSAIWPLRTRQRLRVLAIFSVLVLVYVTLNARGHLDAFSFPWLDNTGDTVGVRGIMQGDPLFGSSRSIPIVWLLLLLMSVVVGLWSSAETLSVFLHCPESQQTTPLPMSAQPQTRAVLLLPFLAAYCLLLAAFFAVFDRYLLEILAVLLVFLLAWHQSHVSSGIPAVAWSVLAVFAILTVAATHDMFSMDRAEIQAASELQAAGIPRTDIRGGFAFDSATQVYAWGYLNDPRIQSPSGAYHPQPEPPVDIRDGVNCNYPFHRYVPALHIRYVISADPSPCLGPAPFAPVAYHTWLPPATRQLFVGSWNPPASPSSATP